MQCIETKGVQKIYMNLLIVDIKLKVSRTYMYNFDMMQHYVIKFVSDLQQVGGFPRLICFPPPIKQTTTIYIVTEILVKVVLNTITLTLAIRW